MHIHWLGNTFVKLQMKPADTDVTVLIDPYVQPVGTQPRSLLADIVIGTHGEKNMITLQGTPFSLLTPGECETHGVLIAAVQGHTAGELMVRIDAEGVSIGHLGNTSKQLTDAQLEVLSGVDVLLVPVGGGTTFDAQSAMKAINSIEPRIVIPIAYQTDTDPDAAPISTFLKEFGSAPNPEKKTIIKKSTLPQEDTQLILLEKE
jgi:L-ascorbate metabolism protein UlaG (beta-lactamase superfamily)